MVIGGEGMKAKIAIVGFSGTKRLAPFDDPEWEIWGLNALYESIPRWDRWFELHQRRANLLDEGWPHIKKLAGMTCPIYMIKHWDDIPTSVEYPLERVLAAFRPYMTSSLSYMVALAILERPAEIGVYGVDTADEEWGSQRPSLEYLLGCAEGRGIKVAIPGASSLLRAPFLYGFQEREEFEFFGKLRACEDDYRAKQTNADEMVRAYEARSNRYAGALRAIRDLGTEWRAPFNIERLAAGEEDA